MILAVVNTGSFQFIALGETEDEARQALLKAWRKHARQTGADPALIVEMLVDGDVNFHPIEAGQVLRDGEPIR